MRNYLNWKYENFTITFRPLVSSVIMPGAWERSVLCQSIIAPCVSPTVDWLTLRPLTDWGRPRTGPQLSPFWPAATSCDVIPCHPASLPASQIIIAFQNWHKHHRCQICRQKSQACIAIKLIYLALLIWASPITKYNRYHILVHQVERGKFSFEKFWRINNQNINSVGRLSHRKYPTKFEVIIGIWQIQRRTWYFNDKA